MYNQNSTDQGHFLQLIAEDIETYKWFVQATMNAIAEFSKFIGEKKFFWGHTTSMWKRVLEHSTLNVQS